MTNKDLEALIQDSSSQNAELRYNAIRKLGASGDPRALHVLLSIMLQEEENDSSDDLLLESIFALGELGNKGATAHLRRIMELEVASIYAKEKAAEALAKLAEVEYLFLSVKSSSETTRAAALYGLGSVYRTHPQVFDVSLARLSDSSTEVKVAAIANLMDIGDKRAVPELKKLLGSSETTEIGETLGEAAKDAIEFLEGNV